MIYSAQGHFSRIIAIRLSPKTDILEGIEEVCETYQIKNGVLLSAIGSLECAKFFTPIALPEKKAGYGYGDEIKVDGPLELLMMSGMICCENGSRLFHFHYQLSNSSGESFGGHVIAGNTVLLTFDAVIAEVECIDFTRSYDDELEVMIFQPKQKKLDL